MFKQEELIPMDEGCVVRLPPVVGTAPRRKADAANLTPDPVRCEAVHQCCDRFARKWAAEELRLRIAISLPGYLSMRRLLDLVVRDAELGLVEAGLAVGELAAVLEHGVGANAGGQLRQQLRGVALATADGPIHFHRRLASRHAA